jgi:hypothetical protein
MGQVALPDARTELGGEAREDDLVSNGTGCDERQAVLSGMGWYQGKLQGLGKLGKN